MAIIEESLAVFYTAFKLIVGIPFKAWNMLPEVGKLVFIGLLFFFSLILLVVAWRNRLSWQQRYH